MTTMRIPALPEARPVARPLAARRAIRAMYVGLALTVAAAIVPFIDRATTDVLAGHIRDMYPDYSDAKVSSDATAYLVYLSIVAALGIVAWLWTIRVAKRRPGGAAILATAMLALGGGIAFTNLFIQEQTGDRAFPLLYGIVGLLPVVPGVAAVALLWKAWAAGAPRSRASTVDEHGDWPIRYR